jgi:hypothetical protein
MSVANEWMKVAEISSFTFARGIDLGHSARFDENYVVVAPNIRSGTLELENTEGDKDTLEFYPLASVF